MEPCPIRLLLPLLLLSYSHLLTAGGDPEGKDNLAGAGSELPSSKGFAADYPGDVGITDHEAVVFAEDFEKGVIGEGWDEIGNMEGKVLSFAFPGAPGLGERCLQVDARLGENTGGGLTRWFDPPETVFVRFYTRFSPDCGYVHHFVGLRANKSLTGKDKWSGFGGAGTQPEGDERFSTRIEPWGQHGKWSPPGRWNFYSYWHEMEKGPDGKYWGNHFGIPSAPEITRDRWICVEFMLKHNTPGEPDGEQAFWIDGELRGHWKGINWRKTENLKANAFTLESYVTDRWTQNPLNRVFFDNIVAASTYIGPIAE